MLANISVAKYLYRIFTEEKLEYKKARLYENRFIMEDIFWNGYSGNGYLKRTHLSIWKYAERTWLYRAGIIFIFSCHA